LGTVLLLLLLLKKCTEKSKDVLPTLVEGASAFDISGDILYQLKQISSQIDKDYIEIITLYSLKNNFTVSKDNSITEKELYKFCIEETKNIGKKYKKKDMKRLYLMYKQMLKDIGVFPIPNEAQYIYADSWEANRDYKGPRKHLGTDVIDINNSRGNIPIVSMTDGVVERMGWNEKGGWRVGIRAPSGAYFYYAHLDSFSHAIKEGMEIKAGQCIGYMGDSGYGKEPGTVGNFPVHLHLGIMLDISFVKGEVWVNPYNILGLAEYNKVNWNPQDEES